LFKELYAYLNESKKEVFLVGTLKKTVDNFIYLDISNDIIEGLRSMLPEEDDAKKPPYDNKENRGIGAHVSVIYTDEYNEKDLGVIKELGKEYKFTTGKVHSVNPEKWDEISKVWFMDVASPDLEKLRQKYGLSKLLNVHTFHISFAVKKEK